MGTNFTKKIVGLLVMALFINNSAMAGGLGKVIKDRKLEPIKEGTASGDTGTIKDQIDPKVEELGLTDPATKNALNFLARNNKKYGTEKVAMKDIIEAAKATIEKNPEAKNEVENLLNLASLAKAIDNPTFDAYIGNVIHMALKSKNPKVLKKVSEECKLIFKSNSDATMIEVEMAKVLGYDKLDKIKKGCKEG